jgi:hypothetical protein
MQYILNALKISGDVLPLAKVADSMARAKATTYGSTSFHKPTYDGAFKSIGTSLVREVKSGNLVVCDTSGIAQPVNNVIEQGNLDNAFNAVATYVVEPNWAQLNSQHPDAEIAPGCWHWDGIDLGETVPDVLISELCYFQTNLHYLNEWAGKAGDSFTLVEMPAKMVDFDLTNVNGNIIEAGYFRVFVEQSSQTNDARVPVAELDTENHDVRGMKHVTYQKLRAYCMQDLHSYMGDSYFSSASKSIRTINLYDIKQINRELSTALAMPTKHSHLSPKELAASTLLHVISNHRIKTIERETPQYPNNYVPLPPLTDDEADVLERRTEKAISAYAAHMSEREAATLLTDWEASQKTKATTSAKKEAVKGITKGAVINAFEDIHFSRSKWCRALANLKSHPWLNYCWVDPPGAKGSRVSRMWSPVLIAVALYGEDGKGVKIEELDAVFARQNLKDWADAWQEASASFRN